ncbi:very short patch repair endonuclease [Lignipirellula cremea]|nr:very short patch repair endonuclease [Lignipirellula cremea]
MEAVATAPAVLKRQVFSMTDIMSSAKRSALMSRIRATDTTPERYIRVLLEAASLEFDQHARDLPGRPDFVFREQQTAVFIDGDFWHGWRFPLWRHRLSDKWREKISKNRERDVRNHRTLRRRGWTVVRIWEHQVEANPLGCIERIALALEWKSFDAAAVETAYAALPPLKRRNRLPKP